MAGDYFSAWYTKEHLFPMRQIIGWNPYHFWGFPQNQFYTPLFSIIVGLLGYLFPLGTSLKIILSIIVLTTPLSFYWFLITHGIDKIRSGYIMLVMSAILIFYKPLIGGNLLSTFAAGFNANALAVPLLFLYLSFLNLMLKRKGIWIVCSIILALILLSHIYYFIAAIMLSFGYLFFSFTKFYDFTKHYILAFLLSAFWSLPSLFKVHYTSKFNVAFASSFMLILLVSMFLTIFYLLKKKIMKKTALGLLLLIVGLLLINSFQIPNIYIHRFIFPILLVDVILISLIFFSWSHKKKAYTLLILISLTYPILQSYDMVSIKQPAVLRIVIIPDTESRFFISHRIDPGTFSADTVQNKLPIEKNIIMTKGVFLESSRNTKIILEIIYAFDSYWSINNLKKVTQNQISNIDKKLNLLDINYLYSPNFTRGLIKENALIIGDKKLNLYKISERKPVEIINYNPQVILKDWDKRVEWWLINSTSDRIFVNKKLPIADYEENSSIENFSFSDNFQKLSFFVDSEKEKNVLIKQSYFPNWKAYNNGKEIPIYLASPYFMLVQGKGLIELRYQKLPIDFIAQLLSVLGILFVIIYIINFKFHRVIY